MGFKYKENDLVFENKKLKRGGYYYDLNMYKSRVIIIKKSCLK